MNLNVDPIAEADIYLAYGRYNQAVEILELSLEHQRLTDEKYLDVVKKIIEITAQHFPDMLELKINSFRQLKKLDPILLGKIENFFTEFKEKRVDVAKTETPSKPVVKPSLKSMMISRLINLGKAGNLPGFSTSLRTREQFEEMDDELFMTFFELIIIQSHKDGHQ